MSPTERAIEAVWRIESSRIVTTLARMLRDVGLAEELAQDALVAALVCFGCWGGETSLRIGRAIGATV